MLEIFEELFLALTGYSGDVFVEVSMPGQNSKSDGPPCIQLSKEVDWIESPDRTILDCLAQLGHHFKAIHGFVEEEVGSLHFSHGPSTPRGSMYCRSLATGLQELMDVYRAKLIEVQRSVLPSLNAGTSLPRPAPTLSRIQYLMADFSILLPGVHDLVREVERLRRMGFKGSELIALLHSRSRCGSPSLQSCFHRLLWHCNQVFLGQLTSWMVHGILMDPFSEFFVTNSALDPGRVDPGRVPLVSHRLPSGPLPLGPLPSSSGSGDDSGHHLDASALPSYVTHEMADSILFVGNSVQLLRNPRGTFQGQELISNKDTLEFAQALQRLQALEVFQKTEFEHAVEFIRARVAARVWQLVVVQADLMGHLEALKDYFLLAKGDFYHNFLVEARDLMSHPPRPSFADADINGPFQNSALRSTAEHDLLFPLLRMRWAPDNSQSKGDLPKLDDWDSLSLEYDAKWPTGLLLTPPVISRYNALFQFLMRLKRVQHRLEGAWQGIHTIFTHAPMTSRLQRGVKTSGGDEGEAGNLSRLRRLHSLRHKMAHLIANLQIYIQLDVIESNYGSLKEAVAEAQDFAEVERSHSHYLHSLVNQCFLNTGTIARAIGSIFVQVQDLCNMVDDQVRSRASGEDKRGDEGRGADVQRRINVLEETFKATSNQLYTYLQSSRLQDVNKAPHLRLLYLRLNFNGFVNSGLLGNF